MRLVDVPWEQALDVILNARNLGMTQIGNVIRVAPLETLKKEEQAVLEAKRSKEKLRIWRPNSSRLNYATAKELLAQAQEPLKRSRRCQGG